MKSSLLSVAAAAACAALAGLPAVASAAVVTIGNPGGSTEIGARLRWGATGFEAGLYDGGSSIANLNPQGAPVWVVGRDYRFEVRYTVATGELFLGIDFSGDDAFGAGETLSASVFSAPGPSSYAGLGFDYLQITGNESGSTGRSSVSGLVINGDAQASLAPGGAFLETFYDDTSGGATGWLVRGLLNYSVQGTAQERPSWNFNLRSAATPSNTVPVPGTVALLGLGLVALGALRRRRA